MGWSQDINAVAVERERSSLSSRHRMCRRKAVFGCLILHANYVFVDERGEHGLELQIKW